MVLKLDNWKDIKNIDSAEKLHQQNERTREQDRSLDKRLQYAFANFRKTKAPEQGRPAGTDRAANAKLPDDQTKLAKPLPEIKHATQPKHIQRQVQVAQTSAEGRRGVEQNFKLQPSAVYQPPFDPVAAQKNVPQTTQASQFVVATPGPSLAHLLKSTLAAPPKAEAGDKKGRGEAEAQTPDLAKPVLTARVQAPIASDAGGKLADATGRQSDGEVGKKKSEKGQSKEAAGGTSSTQHAGRSTQHEGGLGAASGGVAGDGGEPDWIIDREPLVRAFNPSTKLQVEEARVQESAFKFKKYVLKPRADEVLARAAHVSEEVGKFLEGLEDQINKNIPAQNPYGSGVRG